MEGFDLRAPLNAFFKRWRVFAQILVGALGIVVIGWFLTPTRFTSTAVLLLESKLREVTQIEKDNPSMSRATKVSVADVLSEVEILMSEELRRRTMDNLSPDVAERLGIDRESEAALSRGAGRLRGGLKVKPVTNSSIINVSFSDGDRDLAVEVVNLFVQTYLEYRSELSLKVGGLDNLEREQERALLAMAGVEQRLREYDREFHLVAAAEQKSALLKVLSDMRSESARKVVLLEKNKQLTSDLRESLDQGAPDISQFEEIRQDETAAYLENQLASQQIELAKLLQHSTEKNHDVIRVRRNIEGIEEALEREREAIVQSLLYARGSETEGVRSEVAAYHDLEMAILAELEQIRDHELQSENLQLELEIKRDNYTHVTRRLDQLRLDAGLGGGGVDVVVASRGYKPLGRSSPRPLKLFLFGALVGGTLLGLAVVLVLDSLDHSFKTPQDVERFLGVPVLATLPKSKLEPGDG